MRDEARPPVAALRVEFGYPEAVIRGLDATVEALRPLAPRSVVLMGSAARGELTWRETGQGLELLSDLELACFVDRRDPSEEARARARIGAIEAATALENGLFHIDVLVARRFPSGKNARGLLWYEAGRSHRVLHGRVRPADFGKVDPSRVSLGLINELVIIRLWWMLVHLPSRLLDASAIPLAPVDRERLVYVNVRNLLDVASIWLPNIGIYKVGYLERARRIRDDFATLPGSEFLPPEFPNWLAEATRKKLDCDLAGDPVEWYGRTVSSYRGLVGYLVGAEPDDPDLAEHVRARWPRRHPAPRSLRFRAYRELTRLRQAARGGGVRWLARREDPAAASLSFMLRMHAAARHRLEWRDAEAEAALQGAAEALAALSPEAPTVPPTGAFGLRWHALRAGLVDPFIRHYRKLRGQHAAVRDLMRLEEEEHDT